MALDRRNYHNPRGKEMGWRGRILHFPRKRKRGALWKTNIDKKLTLRLELGPDECERVGGDLPAAAAEGADAKDVESPSAGLLPSGSRISRLVRRKAGNRLIVVRSSKVNFDRHFMNRTCDYTCVFFTNFFTIRIVLPLLCVLLCFFHCYSKGVLSSKTIQELFFLFQIIRTIARFGARINFVSGKFRLICLPYLVVVLEGLVHREVYSCVGQNPHEVRDVPPVESPQPFPRVQLPA